MFELTIENEVYQFNFDMGFLREINHCLTAPIDGAPGSKQNIGARYTVARLIDRDAEALVEVLDIANKRFQPRITRAKLDNYVDDENTDINQLFEDVLGFLGKANATRNIASAVQEAVEKERRRQEMIEQMRTQQMQIEQKS